MTMKPTRFELGLVLAGVLVAIFATFVIFTKPARAASCGSYPFTLQNNTTADATQVMANFNTVRNCVINNAAGSGVNTDITSITGLSTPLSQPQGGSAVYIGGTSTGTANAQIVASPSPIGFSLTSGFRLTFTAGATNTGATTLNANSTGATAIRKNGPSGLEALTGGEIVSGNIIEALYNGTFFVLLSDNASTGGGNGTLTNITAATTVDLGTIATHNANITGSGVSIAAFGSTATTTSPVYRIKFAAANTLVYNATSMIIPGLANITTAANDTAVVEYLGSGNWQVLSYTKASGAGIVAITPLCGATGFTLANSSGTPNTLIDTAADRAVMLNSSGNSFTATSISASINTATNGAVNTLDTGSLTTSTWYNFFLISNGTTTGGLASLSATAPTLPSGYTYFCRLGAMRTDGSSNFYRTSQKGRDTVYTVVAGSNVALLPAIQSGATGTCTTGNYTSFAVAAFVPPTATQINLTVTNEYNGGAVSGVCLAPANVYGATNSTNPAPVAFDAAATARMHVMATLQLLSTNIFFTSSGSGGGLQAVGWRDKVNAD